MLHLRNQRRPLLGANHYEWRGLEVPHLQPGQPRLRRAESRLLCRRGVLWLGGLAAGKNCVQVRLRTAPTPGARGPVPREPQAPAHLLLAHLGLEQEAGRGRPPVATLGAGHSHCCKCCGSEVDPAFPFSSLSSLASSFYLFS